MSLGAVQSICAIEGANVIESVSRKGDLKSDARSPTGERMVAVATSTVPSRNGSSVVVAFFEKFQSHIARGA